MFISSDVRSQKSIDGTRFLPHPVFNRSLPRFSTDCEQLAGNCRQPKWGARIVSVLFIVAAFFVGAIPKTACAEVPKITDITPSTWPAGSSNDLTLTITGTGFTSSSVVLWNTLRIHVTGQSDTQLTGVVPSAYLATNTSVEIVVQNSPTEVSSPWKFPSDLPEGIDLLLGIGASVRGPVNDYVITNNFISTKNIGWLSPEALVGISVALAPNAKLPFVNRLNAFASTQFSAGTSAASTLTSFTLGFGYHINKYLHFLAGYSLSPTSQPSPGFRNAAALYIANHPCPGTSCDAAYAAFDAPAIKNNSINAFDGFPVPQPTPPMPTPNPTSFTYSGSILETKYGSGLFVGFAFPLSFRSGLETH